ncbi:hypothetical protein CEUSTIGMA_g908.t1 [Chlamydomonas eustigma]|uniref:Uncharacterized protein n=1 Tax=Chlamydomonas eustigma TaxID=1157962 RepID=A0A250WRX5_9CHLO|nr:hypothetical protein CEUSTIGMA_g908.t1 [Chlamydomonas eustigma]|eukprot:GAX73456.1 hypothetical protein CEUSTIGMA_g908.t1 [Chlamydomonas eustigma]
MSDSYEGSHLEVGKSVDLAASASVTAPDLGGDKTHIPTLDSTNPSVNVKVERSRNRAAIRKSKKMADGEMNGYQHDYDQWWPGYLASTLTGWTLNAVNTCFCDKCSRTFSSGISTLQHFQSSYRHFATVEALEASGVLHVYQCSQMMQYNYAMGYYDNGTEQYSEQYNHHSNPPAIAAPVPVHARSSSVSSPSLSNGIAAPPSDVFTASSEVSEQEEQQHTVSATATLPTWQGQQQRGSYRKQYKLRQGVQKHQKHPSAALSSNVAPVKGTPAQPTQTYESAFPALGGVASTSAPRRWTPAFASRKLRTDAPAWAPGQPTDAFLALSIQARVAKEQAPKTATSEVDEGSQAEVGSVEPAQKLETEATVKVEVISDKIEEDMQKVHVQSALSSPAPWSKVLGRKAARAN